MNLNNIDLKQAAESVNALGTEYWYVIPAATAAYFVKSAVSKRVARSRVRRDKGVSASKKALKEKVIRALSVDYGYWSESNGGLRRSLAGVALCSLPEYSKVVLYNDTFGGIRVRIAGAVEDVQLLVGKKRFRDPLAKAIRKLVKHLEAKRVEDSVAKAQMALATSYQAASSK